MNPPTPAHWLRQQTSPLNLAAHITWMAVAADLWRQDFGVARSGMPMLVSVSVLVLFVLALLANFGGRLRGPACTAAVLVQGVCALALVACTRVWSTPILVIIVVAQSAALWSTRALSLWMLVSNLVLYAIIAKLQWDVNAALSVVMQVGFQSFAVLMTRFAASAEQRAEELRAINAELVATRSLLAEGVRDQERLRLSRELHDVAGHKLTALKLNLRALQQQAPADLVDDVAQCTQLADELLGDLRGVVRQMRSDDGIDLGRALNSLAAPFRKPAVRIVLDPAVRVDSLELAQTIVRVVQEGITNAVRHADAEHATVTLCRDGERLRLDIADDGRATAPIRAGHGLTGMRERIEEHGGELRVERGARGTTLRIQLPA
ncbi:MAG TPA: sensor histidine kinase [Pseudomonadota bacterium]|jgi:signal transduction histidine kinase|nr:sensor histidine kinase [Pseudomonadota bacterium]